MKIRWRLVSLILFIVGAWSLTQRGAAAAPLATVDQVAPAGGAAGIQPDRPHPLQHLGLVPPAAVYDEQPQATGLPDWQTARLHEASLRYLAPTHADAERVAIQIGFNGRNGHPSNMCGPLAFAEARDAGLFPPDLSLNRFWLLNPHNQGTLESLAAVMPPEAWWWYEDRTPIDEMDWSQFPLYAGDILYLYSGPRGTFEHVLTVTRVDEAGRAYSVTNLRQADDTFRIHEVMLYDPAQPGVGQFYDWTDRRFIRIGLTGTDGFRLWRPLPPAAAEDRARNHLRADLNHVFGQQGGDWHVAISEIGGPTFYERRSETSIHSASLIKIPIALLTLKKLEQYNTLSDLDRYIHRFGTEGDTYYHLLNQMLVYSDESATAVLTTWLQTRQNSDALLADWGAPNTNIVTRHSSAADINRLLTGLYAGDLLSPEAREIMLQMLASYTINDDTRLGLVSQYLPNAVIYNKRGTIVDGLLIVADAAIVRTPDASYVVVMIGHPTPELPATYAALDQAIAFSAPILSYRLLWDPQLTRLARINGYAN